SITTYASTQPPNHCCRFEAVPASVRGPSVFSVPARVLLFTFLAALLSFAISLLCGILGIVIVSAARGARPNLPFAYRHIALPIAIAAAAVVLVWATIIEVRQYRQARALAAIERIS